MLAELDEAGNQTRTYTLGNEYAGQQVNLLNNSLTSENASASYYITDEQGSGLMSMRLELKNIEATKLVLRIVLNKPDIKVVKIKTQYSMKNIKGRSLRLDIYATDSKGRKYNIEIQRADKGARAKRARYNSSLIDTDILPAGFEVENLSETFVIFITENDVIGRNKPIYYTDRYISETEEYFDDGSNIIYVNASYKDDIELGKLMHDFSVIEPDDMNFKVLADIANYYKKDKEGIQAMCKVMEDMISEFVTDEKKIAAVRMLKRGKLTYEEIAEDLELPLGVIEKSSEELSLT